MVPSHWHACRACNAVLMGNRCSLQEVGKENLFIFGMDESEVPAWRESKREWKDYDPRFVKAIEMVRDGTFGDKEYFQVRISCHRIRADDDKSCMKD